VFVVDYNQVIIDATKNCVFDEEEGVVVTALVFSSNFLNFFPPNKSGNKRHEKRQQAP